MYPPLHREIVVSRERLVSLCCCKRRNIPVFPFPALSLHVVHKGLVYCSTKNSYHASFIHCFYLGKSLKTH